MGSAMVRTEVRRCQLAQHILVRNSAQRHEHESKSQGMFFVCVLATLVALISRILTCNASHVWIRTLTTVHRATFHQNLGF
jgi:hypothetical protein